MLRLTGFQKKYDNRLIVSVPDITFTTGLHWVRGENGSGKSTLFRCIAGMLPYTGDILLKEEILERENPVTYRSLVSFSEAEPLYPPFLTGKELFNFVAKARNAARENINYCTQLFRIDRYFTQSCDTYSSGMLKKLSLTISFLGEPSVVVLDEPFITLDADSTQVLIGEIKRQVVEKHNLILISSHQKIESTIDNIFNYKISGQTLVVEKS